MSVAMTPKRLLGLLVAGASASAACAPDSAGRQGERVESLYGIFLVVAAVVFLVVSGLIAWSILKYRGSGEVLPPQTKTNVKLEILWFAIPTLLVIVLFALSTGVLGEVNEEVPDPDVTIHVEGFQWGWRFSYEGTDVVVESLPQRPAEVVLPVGRPVAFLLSSPDVVHSLYIPRFLIKRDVVPGRTNRLDVTIEDEGSYGGACAEFCGLLHHEMTFTVRAVSGDAYDEWLEQEEAKLDGR